jgi:arylsulfatase A-like enzyme
MSGNQPSESIVCRSAIAAISLIAAAISACGEPPPLDPPKHVLLLVIDTQRADHLSCYGNKHPTTPVLDALAREGVRFENAVSQCSWTLPSMVSMMTSSYIADEPYQVPGDKVALAEVFKSAGWSTGAFICNDLLSPDNHFQRGFDVFEWQLTPYSPNDPIIDWIQKTKNERTFTFVHLNEVHDPYRPPKEYTHYRNLVELPPADRLRYYDEVSKKLGLTDREKSLREIAAEIGGYDDDVHYCDERIGGIFAAIKAAGQWESTAILVGADHGEGLWTREQYMHGTRLTAMKKGEPPTLLNTLQQTHGSAVNWELVHVPMILKAPGIAGAKTVDGYVENVDIAPTLIELAGLKAPITAQGKSLVRLARDPSRKQAREETLKEGLWTYTRFVSSIITQDGLQYIRPTSEGVCAFNLTDELYDLNSDPEERRNLAASKRDVAKKLEVIAEHRLTIGVTGNKEVTEGTLRSLKGFGYTGSGVVPGAVREEIAHASTADLLLRMAKEPSCLVRLEIVRELKERELAAKEREELSEIGKKEVSPAVREALDALPKRP